MADRGAVSVESENITEEVEETLDSDSGPTVRPSPRFYIIHGYLGSIEEQWVHSMANAIYRRKENQVIKYDWSFSAAQGYIKSSYNTGKVGKSKCTLK